MLHRVTSYGDVTPKIFHFEDVTPRCNT